MFYFVPLAGGWWKMTDRDGKSRLVGQSLGVLFSTVGFLLRWSLRRQKLSAVPSSPGTAFCQPAPTIFGYFSTAKAAVS